jgi:hypothetical protein
MNKTGNLSAVVGGGEFFWSSGDGEEEVPVVSEMNKESLKLGWDVCGHVILNQDSSAPVYEPLEYPTRVTCFKDVAHTEYPRCRIFVTPCRIS